MDCKHENTEGPYFLMKPEWVDRLYREVFNFQAKEVWVCVDCGVVVAKQKKRESDEWQ